MPKSRHFYKKPKHTKKTKPVPEKFYPLPKNIVDYFKNSQHVFNFGLYFNKYLWVTKDKLEYKFQAKPKIKVPSKTQEQDLYQADEILNKYKKSCLPIIKNYLQQKHQELNQICQTFQKLGYIPLDRVCKLQSPLIIGLGNAHPTERGFSFHWTLGIPYILAESIKGVVRLAYLVNRAEEDDSFFENWANEDENFWKYLAHPFGRAEKEKGAERGKVVFLDAFPVEPPALIFEITTCHYSEYYSGNRGPTEDQNPNPLPFLAVAPGTNFRFVFLMHESLKDYVKEKLVQAFEDALTEHGFGAKTSLGHGRFHPSPSVQNPRFKLRIKGR